MGCRVNGYVVIVRGRRTDPQSKVTVRARSRKAAVLMAEDHYRAARNIPRSATVVGTIVGVTQ